VSSARGSRVNDAQSRDKGRLRRHLVALAIDQAMASQWPQAIETNLYLINASGRDVEAYNRLGKAYTQLGRVSEACEAYTATLQIDPTNAIARRNVTRLAALIDGAAALEDSGAQMRRAAP
jgi:Flp pilus assembly protein TadD